MIPSIEEILYATDLSENSAYAFRYATNSAKRHDADIIILHVLEKLPPMAHALVDSQLGQEHHTSILKEKMADIQKQIKSRLELFCEKELENDPESEGFNTWTITYE